MEIFVLRRWSTIAANLPGRTDNEIKNYWNTHIKKKLFKMGIDPVTHAPRLDVLQLASILNTSLFNSSPQFNYPSGRSVINPSQLLSLLSTLLSCQTRNNVNPDNVFNHSNFHQNDNQLLQNQPQSSQMQLHDTLQTFQPNQVSLQENLISKSNPLNMELHQLMKSKLENQTSPIPTSFSHQNTLPNLWHCNNGDNISDLSVAQSSSAMQCFSSPKFNTIFNSLLENQNLCNNEGVPNFNLSSLLSSTTSSSSPSALNSSSSTTFVNGTTEDERDTYGSNMLMYNISNGLNDSGLL